MNYNMDFGTYSHWDSPADDSENGGVGEIGDA